MLNAENGRQASLQVYNTHNGDENFRNPAFAETLNRHRDSFAQLVKRISEQAEKLRQARGKRKSKAT